MKLSINRLREFCDRADSAHAALIASRERLNHARRDVERTERNLDTSNDSSFQGDNTKARLEAELGEAKEAYAAARAAHERCQENHGLCGSLASRGREYAKQLGKLPVDLRY